MKRTVFAWTIAMVMLAVPAVAQRGGGAAKPHGSSSPKPVTAQGSTKPRGGAPKTTTKATIPSSKSKTATTRTSTTTLTPVQQKLQKNTNLASKLTSRLPAGTDLNAAAAGFRNLGQFVAAVNVSNNLGIPFAQLKTRMVDQGMSLGQAIQDARPSTTDTTSVARRAERDADDLIRTTDSTKASKTGKTSKTPTGRK